MHCIKPMLYFVNLIMTNSTPQAQYQQQLAVFQLQLAQLERRRKNLGWLRFLVFVVMVAVAYKVFTTFGVIGLVPTVIGIAILLYLVSVDVKNNANIRNTKTLIQINDEELDALQSRFQQREDGSQFFPSEHAYANDLD
ncbi:MAG: hypothetical protein EON98_12815, partial [Chitinophagaceae bacterium]